MTEKEIVKSGDIVKYIGEKSKYLKIKETYKVRSVLKCPACGDDLLELYGFDDNISWCRFCDSPILKNCFSLHRFIKVN